MKIILNFTIIAMLGMGWTMGAEGGSSSSSYWPGASARVAPEPIGKPSAPTEPPPMMPMDDLRTTGTVNDYPKPILDSDPAGEAQKKARDTLRALGIFNVEEEHSWLYSLSLDESGTKKMKIKISSTRVCLFVEEYLVVDKNEELHMDILDRLIQKFPKREDSLKFIEMLRQANEIILLRPSLNSPKQSVMDLALEPKVDNPEVESYYYNVIYFCSCCGFQRLFEEKQVEEIRFNVTDALQNCVNPCGRIFKALSCGLCDCKIDVKHKTNQYRGALY
jgi:hypothetical protein